MAMKKSSDMGRSSVGGPLGLGLATLAALTACTSPPAPMLDAGTDAQAADAGTDAGPVDAGSDAGPMLRGFDLAPWAACPGVTVPTTQVDCSTLTVPIDWSRPTGPTITRPVRRYHASGDRIGVLLWNPGGPGGVEYFSADPLTGTSPPTLARFDRISVDWRGVGSTRPVLSCPTPPSLAVLRNVTASGSLPGAAEASLAYGERAMTECLPAIDPVLAQHAGTPDMARDMEALRIALGEEQLNYVGFSYGTGLGALYATMYPDRVRAFVLDSPITPRRDAIAFADEQLASQEAGLHLFLDWCVANPTRCAFAAGRDAAALFDVLVAIDQELAARPRHITGPSGATAVADATGFVDWVDGSILDPAGWPRLGTELALAEHGDLSGIARTVGVDGATWDASFYVIFSLDRPFAPWLTPTYFVEHAREVLVASPFFGARYVAGTGAHFAVPPGPEAMPEIHAPTAPPMLVIANRGDMNTPYAWGAEMRDALGNGSYLVTYDGVGHARSPNVPCLRTLANAFLVDPTTAPTTTSCAAVTP